MEALKAVVAALGGKKKTGGKSNSDCKWCQQGECWSH